VQCSLLVSVAALQAAGRGTTVKTTLAASFLSCVSFFALVVLSDFEHCRTVRPSAIIQLFLFSTILLDLPRVRTAWLLDANYTAASIFTVTFSLRILLLALESRLKWKYTESPDNVPPEERQGIFGRIFFWWLMPMFLEGYKRDLTMEDLFAIDDDLKGDRLLRRLTKSWNSGQ